MVHLVASSEFAYAIAHGFFARARPLTADVRTLSRPSITSGGPLSAYLARMGIRANGLDAWKTRSRRSRTGTPDRRSGGVPADALGLLDPRCRALRARVKDTAAGQWPRCPKVLVLRQVLSPSGRVILGDRSGHRAGAE